MSGWRPLLRLAWRDVVRARGRSLLVLVLVALPVLAVTIALAVTATEDVTGTEALERRLGAADARISVEPFVREVAQGADPDRGSSSGELSAGDPGAGDPAEGGEVLAVDGIAEVLDREVRAVPWYQTERRVRLDDGAPPAALSMVDLTDPLAEGLAELDEGRLPEAPGEAIVNQALASRGVEVGERLTLTDGTVLQVVGLGEDSSSRTFPVIHAAPGTIEPERDRATTWLVEAGDVTWPEVRALNERGALVLSRAVMHDPPSEHELPLEMQYSSGSDSELVAVVALLVAMTLLEVVLLAGPAFAVTARRQARTLALMSAVGGTPAQARRAILAIAVVLGGLAALLGVLGGVLLARFVAVPIAQRFSSSWMGPFDVPWAFVVAVACLGLLSAVLAAALPAHLASRMDVVAVLAGRRGEPRPSTRSPLLGLVLLGVGVAGAVMAGTGRSNGGRFTGETTIAASGLVSVLGMVLLVPVVVAGLAGIGGRLPLPIRYAVRDAARNRTRTVPAVAAVAATVCGVVALAIGSSSDLREAEATYAPQLPRGDGVVRLGEGTPQEWARVEGAVRRELPRATVTPVLGVPQGDDDYVDVTYRVPGERDRSPLSWVVSGLGSSSLVGEEIPAAIHGISPEERRRGDAALAAGEVVVFTDRPVTADTVRIAGTTWDEATGQEQRVYGPATVPATYLEGEPPHMSANAVLPPQVAEDLDVLVTTVGLHVTGTPVSAEQERAVDEVVATAATYGSFYVERGYQPDAYEDLVLWVLAGLGGVLMIGGTLTVTYLALNDGRPDLATLSAVGAAPSTRRAVAASYALVVGLVGAVLGAVVGFVPGIAVSYPLTTASWSGTGPYLEIPWLMIAGVVVGLPLLTALVVGATTRGGLPMVRRLD